MGFIFSCVASHCAGAEFKLPRHLFTMSDERHGFSVPAKDSKKNPDFHPGWKTFCSLFSAVENNQEPVYSSTTQVLEQLNTIVQHEYCTEKEVYDALVAENYTNEVLSGGTIYWKLFPL